MNYHLSNVCVCRRQAFFVDLVKHDCRSLCLIRLWRMGLSASQSGSTTLYGFLGVRRWEYAVWPSSSSCVPCIPCIFSFLSRCADTSISYFFIYDPISRFLITLFAVLGVSILALAINNLRQPLHPTLQHVHHNLRTNFLFSPNFPNLLIYSPVYSSLYLFVGLLNDSFSCTCIKFGDCVFIAEKHNPYSRLNLK